MPNFTLEIFDRSSKTASAADGDSVINVLTKPNSGKLSLLLLLFYDGPSLTFQTFVFPIIPSEIHVDGSSKSTTPAHDSEVKIISPQKLEEVICNTF